MARWRIKPLYLALALIASLIAASLSWKERVEEPFWKGRIESLELKTLDYRFRLPGRSRSSDDIVIIYIDDVSIQLLGGGNWPLTRDKYAELVEKLSKSEVKAIGFDIFLPTSDRVNAENDEKLAAASRLAGNVYYSFAFANIREGIPPHGAIDATLNHGWRVEGLELLNERGIQILHPPLEELAESARSLGHVNIVADLPEAVVRRTPLLIRYAGRLYPSLAFTLACRYYGVEEKQVRITDGEIRLTSPHSGGDVRIPINEEGQMLINYAGGLESFKRYPLYEVLQSQSADQRLKGKLILVGVTAERLAGDKHYTPLSSSRDQSGIVIHANALNTIIQQEFLKREGKAKNLAIVMFLGLLTGVIMSVILSPEEAVARAKPEGVTLNPKTRWVAGSIAFVAILFIHFAVAFTLFRSAGTWIDIVAPTLAIACSYIIINVSRYTLSVLRVISVSVATLIRYKAREALLYRLLRGLYSVFLFLIGFFLIWPKDRNIFYLYLAAVGLINLQDLKDWFQKGDGDSSGD